MTKNKYLLANLISFALGAIFFFNYFFVLPGISEILAENKSASVDTALYLQFYGVLFIVWFFGSNTILYFGKPGIENLISKLSFGAIACAVLITCASIYLPAFQALPKDDFPEFAFAVASSFFILFTGGIFFRKHRKN